MTNDDPASPAEVIQTILLVEDDEDAGVFIAQVLKEERPYVVLHMTDGAHALEAVGSIKPNLFILDYRLPGFDGLELFDRLHAIPGLEMVPALMMSATYPSQKEIQKRHISFLTKPFEISDLLAVVDELLAK